LVASTVRDLAAELAHIAPNASSSTSSLDKIQAGVNVDLLKREEGLPLPSSRETNGATLTPRELEILRYAQIGLTNKRIAAIVSLTEQTVKFHLSNLYGKLGVENRTQAVQFAIQQGLLAATDE
jgi:DNA-binding NarL/FixJ family response regulator